MCVKPEERSRSLNYYYAHRDEILAERRKYYAENKEVMRAYAKRYRDAHRAEHNRYQREWARAHPDVIRRIKMENYARRREAYRAAQKDYYQRNRERCLASVKAWQAKNRSRVNEANRRRTAEKIAANYAVAAIFRDWREEQAMTQAEVGQLLGVTRQCVWLYEQGAFAKMPIEKYMAIPSFARWYSSQNKEE